MGTREMLSRFIAQYLLSMVLQRIIVPGQNPHELSLYKSSLDLFLLLKLYVNAACRALGFHTSYHHPGCGNNRASAYASPAAQPHVNYVTLRNTEAREGRLLPPWNGYLSAFFPFRCIKRSNLMRDHRNHSLYEPNTFTALTWMGREDIQLDNTRSGFSMLRRIDLDVITHELHFFKATTIASIFDTRTLLQFLLDIVSGAEDPMPNPIPKPILASKCLLSIGHDVPEKVPHL